VVAAACRRIPAERSMSAEPAAGNGLLSSRRWKHSNMIRADKYNVREHEAATISHKLPRALRIAHPVIILIVGMSVWAMMPSAAGAVTPTVSEFLNAANAEYVRGVPATMRPFTPMPGIDSNGFTARVWITTRNQIIIAYPGAFGGQDVILKPAEVVTQIISDILTYLNKTPTPLEADALNFANSVISAAAREGYSTADLFVTGHSLGGIMAEYVASQTGLGGISFEATGLPFTDWHRVGTNFVSIVTFGDPVGSFASDVDAEWPLGPPYRASGGGLPHYGHLVMIGRPSNQDALVQTASKWDNVVLRGAVLAELAALLLEYHLPGTQAHDLGVRLKPFGKLDELGKQDGTVLDVATSTIPELAETSDRMRTVKK